MRGRLARSNFLGQQRKSIGPDEILADGATCRSQPGTRVGNRSLVLRRARLIDRVTFEVYDIGKHKCHHASQ